MIAFLNVPPRMYAQRCYLFCYSQQVFTFFWVIIFQRCQILTSPSHLLIKLPGKKPCCSSTEILVLHHLIPFILDFLNCCIAYSVLIKVLPYPTGPSKCYMFIHPAKVPIIILFEVLNNFYRVVF